jgi:hypothetical protein
MNRLRLVIMGSVAALCLAAASPARASGPAPLGKALLTLRCAGLGQITVSLPTSPNNRAAGQIVGMQGHGIPVSSMLTVTDETTGQVVFSGDSTQSGHGHGHPNQQTITCSFTQFEGPASQIFTGPLPPGVSPTDHIIGVTTIEVIAKL